jgi:hypothetical protein
VPHDEHGRQWPGVRGRVEGLDTRDEGIGIPAGVGMMRPDEIPAAAPCLVNLVLVHR